MITTLTSFLGQGCGNTEMLCLSPGKLSEKSYLSGQNPTCAVLFKHLILANTVAGS